MNTQGGVFSTLGRYALLAVGVALFVSLLPQPATAAPRFEVNIFLPGASDTNHTVTDFQNSLGGVDFQSAKWYLDWSDAFYAGAAHNLHAQGLIPELTWQPKIGAAGVPYNEVVAGNYDSYLNQTADTVKNLGYSIRISLAPEMNGDWTPWSVSGAGNSPEGFKSFYRYVVQKFRDRGATNVEWIWAPNVRYGDGYSYASMYPGDDYVTYTGLDGYNWGTTQSWSTWMTFRSVFQSSYNELVALTGKQIIITEMASTEVGGNKAQWITAMHSDLNNLFPRIKGITWFNINKETDWRVESSEASKQAFVTMMKGSSASPATTSAVPAASTAKKSTATNAPVAVKAAPAEPVAAAESTPVPSAAASEEAVVPTVTPVYTTSVIQASVPAPQQENNLLAMLERLTFEQRQQIAFFILILIELPLVGLLFAQHRYTAHALIPSGT